MQNTNAKHQFGVKYSTRVVDVYFRLLVYIFLLMYYIRQYYSNSA